MVLRGKDHVRAVVVVILSQLQLGQFILHTPILAGFAAKMAVLAFHPPKIVILRACDPIQSNGESEAFFVRGVARSRL